MRIRILVLFLLAATISTSQQIPKVWAAEAVAGFVLPLAQPAISPVQISEADYYSISERTLYKTYPIYQPGREPKGYFEWLQQQEPQVAFDATKYKTEADWIAAGEAVFHAPVSFEPMFFTAADLRDAAFYRSSGMPVAADGTVPFVRWIVRKKGNVELGSLSCATCHVRVLPDGRVAAGAPSNNPTDRQGARLLKQGAAMGPKLVDQLHRFATQFEVPGLTDDPHRKLRDFSLDDFVGSGEAIPPGVTVRSGTSLLFPPQIPDLIGVKERQHLDHTGLFRHRDISDLMRYSTLAQDVGALARYGDGEAPKIRGVRYSDPQLYALAMYLYSLQPPVNPNPVGAESANGQKIFAREGCGRCHTAPLYTNNQLIPWKEIGVDPRFTTQSRKATGYYKVPSLKGVWYRAPLEHNGSVATLEDWFDPARLREDYRPTGFRGYGVERRAVPGHEFGLKLTAQEKSELIAFLRTL